MMSRRDSPKLGIYFSHYECYGHTSRVMTVAQVFKKRFPKGNLFFIQAGIKQSQSRISQLGKVYSLPVPFMDRNSFRGKIQSTDLQIQQRSRICKDILSRENPDLFITEFFPLGRESCRYELIPSLIQASIQGSVLWGVAGYPLLTGVDSAWRKRILKLYQKIIIFSPVEEKTYISKFLSQKKQQEEYSDFFSDNKDKISFAGYMLPLGQVVKDDKEKKLLKSKIPKGACQIVVLRGGGAVYPKVIAEAIRASDLLGEEYYFTVVAGPSTTPKEWHFFSTLVAKKKINNLVLFKSVGDYEKLLAKGDVCVSIASYHTSAMLLRYHKKAIVIPFEGYGQMEHAEQPARASLLKKELGAQILSIDNLTARKLATSIKKMSDSSTLSFNVPKQWFNGAEFLDQQMTKLFSL